MPETKPPVSQTKTAEQFATEYGYMANNTFTFREIVALLERWAKAKESELAALREQQADAFEMQNREIAALKHELAASERIAEGLAEIIYKISDIGLCSTKGGQWSRLLALKPEIESVLARYQAQKGKP